MPAARRHLHTVQKNNPLHPKPLTYILNRNAGAVARFCESQALNVSAKAVFEKGDGIPAQDSRRSCPV